MKTAIGMLRSMRPVEAAIKNLFVAAALVFGKKAEQSEALLTIAFAYAVFWLISGCVYILNDLLDRASDREHPAKSARPIASGRVGTAPAVIFILVVLSGSFVWAWFISPPFALVAGIYLALNISYSVGLKRIVLIDAMVVAMGFLLRVVAGGVAIDVEIRPWILVSTMLLALLLAFAKRRHELVLLGDEAKSHRGVLGAYSARLLDQIIGALTAAVIITYCLYTLNPETQAKYHTARLPYTIPFVMYGVLRYLYLIHQKEGGGHVGRTLLTDPPLLIDVLLWGISVLLIIYVWH